MPTTEELCFGFNSKSQQEFRTRDIDDLVLEIKENLKLKSRPSHLVSKSKLRSTPYIVPTRSESNSKMCHRNSDRRKSDDPYELLQELLKDGDLIKEAVRRLQNISPQQHKHCGYSESDDELRTPPIPFNELEV